MCKGSSQTTQTSQTYTADPATRQAGLDAFGRAQGAAQLPFQMPQAPVADFTPDQLMAFQNVRDLQGMTSPYFTGAQDWINQSAQTITPDQINAYYNPMADKVLANLAEEQGRQRRDVTGRLTQAAGGVGADRIAVGQAELARQQGLATGATAAGLYTPALAAAQQEKQRQAQAAFALAQMGPAAQQAMLTGNNALLGTGGLQQQLRQAQLNAPFEQEKARLAYPFQTADFLTNTVGRLAPAFGGSTAGTQTTPGPSALSQILGAGTALAGIAGGVATGNPFMAMSGFGSLGKGSGTGRGSSGSGGFGYRHGGPVGRRNFDGFNPFAFGGAVSPFDIGHGFDGGGAIDMVEQPDGSWGATDGFAVGGTPLDTFDTRFPFAGDFPTPGYLQGATREEVAAPFVNAGQRSPFMPAPTIPLPAPRPPGAPQALPFAPAPDTELPPEAAPTAGVPPPAMPVPKEGPGMAEGPVEPGSQMPFSGEPGFANSPWAALTAAGLGMLASKSPFAGVAIGEGGLKGLQTLQQQRQTEANEKRVNLEAQRLAQQAKLERERMAQQKLFHETMTPYQKETLERQKIEMQKPFIYGKDRYGNPVYAIRDEKGNYLDPRTRKPIAATEEPETPAAVPAPATPQAPQPTPTVAPTGETELPKEAIFTQGDVPVTVPANPNVLLAEKPGDAALIKAIAEGRMAPLSLARQNPRNMYIMEKVQEYTNGTFDATLYASRQRTLNEFRAGMSSRVMDSTKLALNHLESFWKAKEKLDAYVTRFPHLNPYLLSGRRAVGDEKLQGILREYETARKAVGDELAKAFMGAGVTAVVDRAEWGRLTEPGAAPAEKNGMFRKAIELLDGRIDVMGGRYNTGMGTQRPSTDLLRKEDRERYERLKKFGQPDEGPKTEEKPKAGEKPLARPSAEVVAKARKAIADGADPEKVKQRLRDAGIDPSGL